MRAGARGGAIVPRHARRRNPRASTRLARFRILRRVAVTFRDYYEVLGVARTATAEEIKRAYRREARKHHPDLKPAAERDRASQLFQQINEAYEVLSDPEKRRKYDALGEHWKSGMEFTPPPGAGARPGAGGDWADLEDLGEFSDFFASLFGGDPARGGGAAATSRPSCR
jgi:curved DNA-binding protein